MLTTKNLRDPRHTPGPWEAEHIMESWAVFAPEFGCVAHVENEPDAALFAVAPELAKAVREYLEGLEDKVAQAKQIREENLGAALAEQKRVSALPMAPVTDALVTTQVRSLQWVLSAAQPLYAILAKVYGTKEDADV